MWDPRAQFQATPFMWNSRAGKTSLWPKGNWWLGVGGSWGLLERNFLGRQQCSVSNSVAASRPYNCQSLSTGVGMGTVWPHRGLHTARQSWQSTVRKHKCGTTRTRSDPWWRSHWGKGWRLQLLPQKDPGRTWETPTRDRSLHGHQLPRHQSRQV